MKLSQMPRCSAIIVSLILTLPSGCRFDFELLDLPTDTESVSETETDIVDTACTDADSDGACDAGEPPPAPILSEVDGTYNVATAFLTVEVTNVAAAATVYWEMTVDGSEPPDPTVASSTGASHGGVHQNGETRIRCAQVGANGLWSPVTRAVYIHDTTPPGSFAITEPSGLTRRHAPPIRWSASADSVAYSVMAYVHRCSGAPLLSSGSIAARWTTWTPTPGFRSGSTICLEVVATDDAGNSTAANNSGTFVFSVETTSEFLAATVGTGGAFSTKNVADINRDGNVDIIVSASDRIIYAFYGRGDGTFDPAQPVTAAMAAGAAGVTTCDVNRDGWLDIVVSVEATTGSGVFVSDGVGGFGALTATQPVPSKASRDPLCADFDGDGSLDLFFLGQGNTVRNAVVYGNGDGTFLPVQTVEPATTWQLGGSLADMNRDGYPDVVLGFWSDEAMVRFGDPAGFTDLSLTGSWSYSQGIHVADADNDGWPDVFVPHWGTDRLVLNNRDGTMAPAVNFAPAHNQYTRKIHSGDYNGDGNLDVFAAARTQDTSALHWGRGDGTFEPYEEPCPVLGNKIWEVQADIDKDGHADLVASVDSDGFHICRHNGAGQFGGATFAAEGTAIGAMTGSGRAVLVADFDRNGTADVLVGYVDGPDRIYTGHGDATFGAGVDVTGDAWPTLSLAHGDVDRDGIDDVVVGIDGEDQMLLGLGDGTFADVGSIEAGQNLPTTGVALADFDYDGNLDIAAARPGGGVYVHPGNGDGTFAASQMVGSKPTTGAACLALADFNRDGQLDIVAGNAADADAPVVYLGRPGGSFVEGGSVTGSGAAVNGVAAADFDLDGIVDVVMVRAAHVGIYLGDGSGGFTESDGIEIGADATAVKVQDLDVDGVPDVVVSTGAGSPNLALRVLRSGMFDELLPLGGDIYDGRDLALADVDQDGKVDAVVAHADAASHLYRGRSDVALLPAPAVTGFVASSVLAEQIELQWDDSGAAGYLVVVRQTEAVSFVPDDGVAYAPGAQGSDEIIFVGSDLTTTHGGLTPLTTYLYRIFAFDSSHTYSAFAGLEAKTVPPV